MPSLGVFYQETIDALREENARLTRERDEAREKLVRAVGALEPLYLRHHIDGGHAGPIEECGRMWCVSTRAALATAKGE